MERFFLTMQYLKKLKIELEKGEYRNLIKGQIRDPEQVYRVFKAIKDKAQETLIGVYLNERLEMNIYDILSVGGESVTLVLPDEIFDRAIVTRSRTFILVHNHPSGDPIPSGADREVIAILSEQSKVMRRFFLDFIIVGDDTYWSMFEEREAGREYAPENAE